MPPDRGPRMTAHFGPELLAAGRASIIMAP